MATSLVLATAALRSTRLRHINARGLPAAALPSHVAVVLAGRRAGSSLRSIGLGSLPMGASFRPPPPRGVACTGSAGGPAEYEEEFELIRTIKRMLLADFSAEFKFHEMPGMRHQIIFHQKINDSFSLWIEVTSHLRPASDSWEYEGLKRCGQAFAAGMAREGMLSWKRANDVVDGLYLLRRIVSSTYATPLPLDWVWSTATDPEYGSEVAFAVVLEHAYQEVEYDIRSMMDSARK